VKNSTNKIRLDALAAVSGVMIALQGKVNGELSARLDNPAEAALISFSSGLIVILLITLVSSQVKRGLRRLGSAIRERKISRWKILAGALGGGFVAIQTSVLPLIGVAIYSVASIAGQTVTSLFIDRIGLTGGGPKLISPQRMGAAAMTILAVLISVADKFGGTQFTLLTIFLAITAGILVGVQRALNGEINEHSGNSYTTSLLNFIMGTSFLTLYFAALLALGRAELTPLPSGPWWIYTGGVIGVVYIAFTALIVQHLGVLTFTLFSVGGQLFGSLLLDLYAPTKGVTVSGYLLAGIVMTYIGVIIGGGKSKR
jgi:transporter family-2 protein